MSPEELESTLRDLPRVGTLIKDRGYRQVWRFEFNGQAFFLKFYPRSGSRLKRLVRGNPALREFTRLIWLQKAKVPSPRAIAHLNGLRLNNQIGDAVVLAAIEPSIQLDHYLDDLAVKGERGPDHRHLADEVLSITKQLAENNLGHGDLHLGNFLLQNGKLFLLDGYAVRKGGLKEKDLLQLGHSVNRHATKADLVRGWRTLVGYVPLPTRNPVAKRQWRKFLERINGDNHYFGKLTLGDYRGVFFKHTRYPRRWAQASQLDFTREQWEKAWPTLLAQIESDQLEILKRSRSGDVLAGEIILGGRPISIVIKRPRRRYWYRYLNEIGRGSRARRAWKKAWNLIVRNIPTAWPLAMVERRTLGYVTDAFFICQRVTGPTVADVDLDQLSADQRENLFRRAGRILRAIESFGFSHFDAKASNWIVQQDDKLGPTPVLVDVDGIRHRQWIALGIRRLLRSMKDHPQYTPEDSLHLCKGYAPFAYIEREAE